MRIKGVVKAIPFFLMPFIAGKILLPEKETDILADSALVSREAVSPILLNHVTPTIVQSLVAFTAQSKNHFDIDHVLDFSNKEHIGRLDDYDADKYKTIAAYYRVNTGKPFQIIKYKDGRYAGYVKSNNDVDYPFGVKPEPNHDKPVAIISGEGAGLRGGFKVYYIGNWGHDYQQFMADNYPEYNFASQFCIHYDPGLILFDLSSLILIPDHTKVSPSYAKNVNEVLDELPDGIEKALKDSNFDVMMGANVEDTYYHEYPSWKIQDQNSVVDPSKPWIEKIIDASGNETWIDNRLTRHIRGLYMSDHHRAYMPERWYSYPHDQIKNRTNDKAETKAVLYHEIGHAIDHLGNYSDKQGFINAYKLDIAKIPDKKAVDVAYFIRKRSEAFAEIVGALMNGYSGDGAKRILELFPHSAEYVRKVILPIYDYNIDIEFVRKNIYPEYLRNTVKDKPKAKDVIAMLCELSSDVVV